MCVYVCVCVCVYENGLVCGDTDIHNRVQYPVNGRSEYFSTLRSVGTDLTKLHVVDTGSVNTVRDVNIRARRL